MDFFHNVDFSFEAKLKLHFDVDNSPNEFRKNLHAADVASSKAAKWIDIHEELNFIIRIKHNPSI